MKEVDEEVNEVVDDELDEKMLNNPLYAWVALCMGNPLYGWVTRPPPGSKWRNSILLTFCHLNEEESENMF